MVAVFSVVSWKMENGDLFGKSGLTNQTRRVKGLGGAEAVVFESALGRGAEIVFLDLKRLLQSLGISKFYADQWGAYERQINSNQYVGGKEKSWRIEGKHWAFRNKRKV